MPKYSGEATTVQAPDMRNTTYQRRGVRDDTTERIVEEGGTGLKALGRGYATATLEGSANTASDAMLDKEGVDTFKKDYGDNSYQVAGDAVNNLTKLSQFRKAGGNLTATRVRARSIINESLNSGVGQFFKDDILKAADEFIGTGGSGGGSSLFEMTPREKSDAEHHKNVLDMANILNSSYDYADTQIANHQRNVYEMQQIETIAKRQGMNANYIASWTSSATRVANGEIAAALNQYTADGGKIRPEDMPAFKKVISDRYNILRNKLTFMNSSQQALGGAPFTDATGLNNARKMLDDEEKAIISMVDDQELTKAFTSAVKDMDAEEAYGIYANMGRQIALLKLVNNDINIFNAFMTNNKAYLTIAKTNPYTKGLIENAQEYYNKWPALAGGAIRNIQQGTAKPEDWSMFGAKANTQTYKNSKAINEMAYGKGNFTQGITKGVKYNPSTYIKWLDPDYTAMNDTEGASAATQGLFENIMLDRFQQDPTDRTIPNYKFTAGKDGTSSTISGLRPIDGETAKINEMRLVLGKYKDIWQNEYLSEMDYINALFDPRKAKALQAKKIDADAGTTGKSDTQTKDTKDTKTNDSTSGKGTKLGK